MARPRLGEILDILMLRRYSRVMTNNSHTLASIAILENLLSDAEREYLAGNPRMVGTLDSEREYLAGHWVWGEYSADEREQMALDNYAGRLTAFMQGTLGLRD